MSNANEPQLHDFLAAALVPTNEQRVVNAVELIHADLERIETRLFAYINSLQAPAAGAAGSAKARK